MAMQRRDKVPESKIKNPITGFVSDDEQRGWQIISPLIFNTFYQTVTQEHSIPRAVEAMTKEFLGTNVNRYPVKVPSTATVKERQFYNSITDPAKKQQYLDIMQREEAYKAPLRARKQEQKLLHSR